jgi:TonB family protein
MTARLIVAVVAACGIAATSLAKPKAVLSVPAKMSELVVYGPLPEYPDEFRRRRIGGSGVFLLRVQIKTGEVTQVLVAQSTGAAPLDAFAVKAFRKWRFKPGVLPYHKITSFRMSPPQTAGEAIVKVPLRF